MLGIVVTKREYPSKQLNIRWLGKVFKLHRNVFSLYLGHKKI